MNDRLEHGTWATLAAMTLAATSGCNAVLGNETAELGDASTTDVSSVPPHVDAATHPTDAWVGPEDRSVPTQGDADATDAPDQPDAPTEDAGLLCGAGEKICNGACVAVTDPMFGCAGSDCAACRLDRAASVCGGGACAVGQCNPGYFDCNQEPSDGCETDLIAAALRIVQRCLPLGRSALRAVRNRLRLRDRLHGARPDAMRQSMRRPRDQPEPLW